MEDQGVSRFPGAEGRIPNFAGAKMAAEKLAGHRLWKRAVVVKANPDSPQTHARRLALEEGKTVIMAVPRLRDPHPFRVLDPKAAVEESAPGGGDDQGRAEARSDRRPRRPAGDRLRPQRLGRRQPQRREGRQRRRLPRPRVRDPRRGGQDRQPHHRRHHGPPDPDRAPAPDGHRPRPSLRSDRHAPRGDRDRAPVRPPPRHPLGPPPAPPDPRSSRARTHGLRLSAPPRTGPTE